MTIGWYVHHHGSGHRTRLLAALPELQERVVALSSLAAPEDTACGWEVLPLDLCPRPAEATAGGTLHWAPLRHAGLRERMSRIAEWIRTHRPAAMVVDVSVEVALLARLHGVPTVLIAQRGRRDDPPHQLAYAQAAAIAAPWTKAMHRNGDGGLPERTRFIGAISRFDDDELPPAKPGGDVLFITGTGGHAVSAFDVRAAAASTPDRTWHVAGAVRVVGTGVLDHGPHADVADLLRRCSVVVGCAGGNVVAEVAAARRPFVCVPQPRPFDEQHHQADALRRAGIAEVCETWPRPEEWPGLLARAEAADPGRWSLLHDGRAAGRLAALVHEVAS
jgi:hypothetical protein